MTEPDRKPPMTDRELEEALLRIAKKKFDDFFTIPTEGMGWDAMKKNLQTMKEVLGPKRDRE